MNLFLYSVLSSIVILITAVFPLAISFADGIGSKRGKGVCFKQVFVALGFGASVLFVRRDTTVGEKEKQLFSD